MPQSIDWSWYIVDNQGCVDLIDGKKPMGRQAYSRPWTTPTRPEAASTSTQTSWPR
jgi:hypothetical protein